MIKCMQGQKQLNFLLNLDFRHFAFRFTLFLSDFSNGSFEYSSFQSPHLREATLL